MNFLLKWTQCPAVTKALYETFRAYLLKIKTSKGSSVLLDLLPIENSFVISHVSEFNPFNSFYMKILLLQIVCSAVSLKLMKCLLDIFHF